MLLNAISQAGTIAVGGHVRPDGDCVGSCMGLYRYVKENFPGKEIQVYLETVPEALRFLDKDDEIRHEIPEDKTYDLFILLDCGEPTRLGFSKDLCLNALHTLCVDHHVSNAAWAEQNYVRPEASSTSELIYDLIRHDLITKECAECLYTGMVHDTGVFRYSCTHPSTMRAAADLMEKGIDFSNIISKSFYEKTFEQNKILGKALMDSRMLFDGRCAVTSIDQKTMEEFHVNKSDLDGIVSQLKMTKDVDLAVFMYELEPDVYKVSLRSTEAVDASRVCQKFGGGGHMRAAGFTGQGSAESVIEMLTEEIKPYF